MKSTNETNYLVLKRFCGEEKYPVETAKWYILEGDGTWDDPSTLWLELTFGKGINLHEDTIELGAEPTWEVPFSDLELTQAHLKSGFTMIMENEDVNYYDGSKPKNELEVIAWFSLEKDEE